MHIEMEIRILCPPYLFYRLILCGYSSRLVPQFSESILREAGWTVRKFAPDILLSWSPDLRSVNGCHEWAVHNCRALRGFKVKMSSKKRWWQILIIWIIRTIRQFIGTFHSIKETELNLKQWKETTESIVTSELCQFRLTSSPSLHGNMWISESNIILV